MKNEMVRRDWRMAGKGWASGLGATSGRRPVNVLTIDVAKQAWDAAAADHVPHSRTEQFAPARMEQRLERALEVLAAADALATFFVQGSVARHHPRLLRRIAAAGHELASHGRVHTQFGEQPPQVFHEDAVYTKRLLEDTTGRPVLGYRAAGCLPVGASGSWTMEILQETGYRYRSGIHPGRAGVSVVAPLPRSALLRRRPGDLLEFPVTTLNLFCYALPCGGRNFQRYPYALSRWALERVNRGTGRACVFYFDLGELDPDSGKPPRHGGRTGRPLDSEHVGRLLRDFRWDRMDRLFFGLADPALGYADGP